MLLCLVAGASIKMTFSVYEDPGQYSSAFFLFQAVLRTCSS